jgi:hypothetical protein
MPALVASAGTARNRACAHEESVARPSEFPLKQTGERGAARAQHQSACVQCRVTSVTPSRATLA